jgi:acetoin utilization deacetylase AcuC-like enzyme
VKVGLLHHPLCLEHRLQPGHPEAPERLTTLLAHLERSGLAADLVCIDDAPEVSAEDVARVHPDTLVADLEALAPVQGLAHLDSDTWLCPATLPAARAAAGAATRAVDALLRGELDRAFCAVRPPGHHAEAGIAMGFCFLNSVAIAARRALEVHGLDRVAILDFDVHHGNGTAQIFAEDPRVLVASSFQHPWYPGRMHDLRGPNLVFTPLPAGTGSAAFRAAIERDWLPALEAHAPQLVLVSAGFDAHRLDPLGELLLAEADYGWITELITDAARRDADGRVLSMLEGGYDLGALARSVEAHVSTLLTT